MSVPDAVREEMKRRLWERADAIDWLLLPAVEKTQYYDAWTRDPDIGDILANYVDTGKIRGYIKDTLLKKYPLYRMAAADRPLRMIGVDAATDVAESYIQPHGRRLHDGRVVCWGWADDWKLVLMALHERTYNKPTFRPFAAVLMNATGKLADSYLRAVIEDAARKLCIEQVLWLEH